MRKTLALMFLPLAVAAPALADRASDIAKGEAELAKLTKGLVPGQPLTCLPPGRGNDSQNIDGVGILYGFGAQKYLIRMDPGCGNLGFNDIPVIVSHGSGPCRGDLVRIIDRGSQIPTGSCVLGDVIPYGKPKS